RLGELWERDEVTFADVSIALCRMHALVRDERWRGSFRRPPGPAAPRVLLSTIRGDQHTFGLSVAADAFRRARWLTSFAGGVDADELVALIATESFDVLALSATNSIATRRIASFVADCRRASKRENLIVVAGGQAFAEGAAAASEFGVDLILERAEAAPEAVRSLIAEQEAER
ncbi:MAG: cobalamin-dependent protein, partial [Pseudomonadota bacterium]